MSLAIGVNWLFAFVVSKLTPIMLANIKYGTFLVFGVFCIIMTLWTYVFLPETTGYALEDIKYLFEDHIIVRALQDAPGGKIFLGGKRAVPVKDLRRADIMEASDVDMESDSSKGGGSKAHVEHGEQDAERSRHHEQHHRVVDEDDAHII
jgi:hypothetical protein